MQYAALPGQQWAMRRVCKAWNAAVSRCAVSREELSATIEVSRIQGQPFTCKAPRSGIMNVLR